MRKREDRHWPRVPAPRLPQDEEPYTGEPGGIVEIPPSCPPCKHRVVGCAVCGTTDRRDRQHSTRHGRGAVARVREHLPRSG